MFFNVGWMDRYQGIVDGDFIKGGGAWVHEYGYGWEVLNFKPWKGRYYGYVKAPRGKLNLARLGAAKGAPYANGVTVVWTAPRPRGGGTYVVGWYGAPTFRKWYPTFAAANEPCAAAA